MGQRVAYLCKMGRRRTRDAERRSIPRYAAPPPGGGPGAFGSLAPGPRPLAPDPCSLTLPVAKVFPAARRKSVLTVGLVLPPTVEKAMLPGR